jgi:hypothetical protein
MARGRRYFDEYTGYTTIEPDQIDPPSFYSMSEDVGAPAAAEAGVDEGTITLSEVGASKLSDAPHCVNGVWCVVCRPTSTTSCSWPLQCGADLQVASMSSWLVV